MDVAVEHQTHETALRIDQRAPGVAAHDIAVRGQVELRVRIEAAACIEPALRNVEGILAGVPLEQSLQVSKWGNRTAVLNPALHGAEVQSQRKGCIGSHTGAEDAEARPGDSLGGRLLGRFHFVLVTLAHGACGCIHESRELHHGILRCLDHMLAPVPQLLPHFRVGKLRALDEACSERIGRVLRQQLPHDGLVRTQPLPHSLERQRECEFLQLGIDRHVRIDTPLQAVQGGVTVLAQSFGVGLLALVRGAHERAGVAEQPAAEARAVLEERVVFGDLPLGRDGPRDVGPGIPGTGSELRIGRDPGAQHRLLLFLALEQPLIVQGIQ